MEKKVFNEFVESHKDFPKKGIIFRDILPLFRKPDVFENLIDEMSNFKISQTLSNL